MLASFEQLNQNDWKPGKNVASLGDSIVLAWFAATIWVAALIEG